jgi:hypothetical protein
MTFSPFRSAVKDGESGGVLVEDERRENMAWFGGINTLPGSSTSRTVIFECDRRAE